MYEAASVHKDLMEKKEQHRTMQSLREQLDKTRGTSGPDSDRVGMHGRVFVSEDKDSTADMDIFLHSPTSGTVEDSY